MPTTLVTGASAGLGSAFARRLAANRHRLVLVARDEQRLTELAAVLQDRHGTPDDGKHEVLTADLTSPGGLAAVEARLRERSEPVDMLVNNAGVGSTGSFWTADLDVLNTQFQLGITAVFRLTRAALEGMTERASGAVLNVASFGALMPGRNGAAYTAAKSYVLSLSAEVAAELAGTGVSVMAVCPGWTRTELHQRSGSECPAPTSGWWLDADEVVEQALSDLARGRRRSVAGRRYRMALAATEALPRMFTSR